MIKILSKNNRLALNSTKGFTLIELLIVVAIIGMLSGVVLSTTKSSKIKSADSAVKNGLKQVIVEAENYYIDNDESYAAAEVANCTTAGTIFTQTKIAEQLTEIKKRVKAGTAETNTLCYALDQSVAVSAVLKSGVSWCVDNVGWSKEGVAQISGANAGACATP